MCFPFINVQGVAAVGVRLCDSQLLAQTQLLTVRDNWLRFWQGPIAFS